MRQQKITIPIGTVFGRRTVIAEGPSNAKGNAQWLCRCICGEETLITGISLRNGHSQGCLKCRPAKHRGWNTPEYRTWQAMKMRCYDPKHIAYPWYGGRGVTVFDGWLNDFAAFLAYVGPKPSPKHSLDRYPNPAGNYEPGNVRWATRREQQRNLRGNVWLELNGVRQVMEDWAAQLGMRAELIRYRLGHGWTVERTLTTPVAFRSHKRIKTA
jgi:hypothetical protein